MISLLRPYVCPRCGAHFPFLLPPGRWVRRGFGRTPDLVCLSCGQVSRRKVACARALCIWPGGAVFLFILWQCLQRSMSFQAFRTIRPTLFGVVLGGVGGLLMALCLRSGFTLLPVDAKPVMQPPAARRPLPRAGTMLVAVLSAALAMLAFRMRHGVTRVGVGVAIGVVVYGVLYFFCGKAVRK